MGEIAATWATYRRLLGAAVRSELQYRVSFWLLFSSQFLITFVDFLEIAVIFGRVDHLAGWSLAEVAFLYGTTTFPFALTDLFVSQVEMVHTRIRTGTFDSLLVRPVPPLLQLMADDFALRRLGKVLQALVVLCVAMSLVDIDWTIGRAVVFASMILSGAAIFAAIFVAGACIQFFTVDAAEFMNSFTYGGNFLAQYPFTVYGEWLRRFFTFIVPVAFVNYLPAVYVLGRPRSDRLGLPVAAAFASPAVAAVVLAAALGLWRFSVRHYRSTGS